MWLVILLLVAGLGFVLWRWLAHSGSEKAPKAATVEPVGVGKATTGDLQVVLNGLGTVTPLATITVQTQINGQLMAVGFTEGQVVNKGDLLAQIDPRPYEIALQQAQGALAHDSGLLAQAKSDLDRYLILSKKNSIAQQQVTDQEFLVQQDQGMVTEDQASIASAKLNLTYCRIVAPVTGRVGLRLVDPGNYIQTSSATGLVVVTQLQPITVIFVLPEDQIPDVAAEVAAGHALAVSAYDRTNATEIAQGTLLTFDNTVDTTTGTVKLRASFPNTDNKLFPNEFVNARLVLKTLSNVVKVPTAAIQHGAPGTFVYLAKPDSSVGVQVVKPGIADGDETEIVSGLKAGDTVVVDGADRLKDGAKIKIVSGETAQTGNTNNGPGAPPGQQPQNAQPVPDQDKVKPSQDQGAKDQGKD